MTQEYVIDIDKLNKSYGKVSALNDFSLKVKKNSIFGLLGPNGAGKTTAIEIVLGLKKQDSGNVSVFGTNPAKSYKKIANRIGVMLQQGGINPGLRPAEALNLYASLYTDTLNVNEVLERVNLMGVQTPVRRLSGGQAQSLSLALAIIGKPELVFLDEPTVGMDPNARYRTWEIINELKDSGATVVLTTHLMDEAEKLCDEIAIVSKGSVVKQGEKLELQQDSNERVKITTDLPIDTDELRNRISLKVEKASDTSFYVNGSMSSTDIALLTKYLEENSVTLQSFNSHIKPLEELFIELTRENETGDENE